MPNNGDGFMFLSVLNYMKYDLTSLMNTINNINIDPKIDMNAVRSSKVYANINRAIDNPENINLKKVKDVKLDRLHDASDYPLMYMVIKRLRDLDLLKRIIEYVVDIDDFRLFTSWYREHHTVLDLEIMKNILKNSKDGSLRDYYDIIFNADTRSPIHKMLYDNNFVSLDILHQYESSDIRYEKYEGDNMVLNFYKIEGDDTNYIDRIARTVGIVRSFAKIYGLNGKHLTLNMFMSTALKRLTLTGGDNAPLCPDNINSGSCLPGHFVNVWRREEMIKVLIHELIHFYKLDFHYIDKGYESIENIISKYIKVDGVDNCNESYTESLATLIYLCIMSRVLSIDFNTMVKNEIKFLLFQVCKIISYFSGESLRDMYRVTMRQNTSVRSYFFIKYIILSNLDRFCEYLDKIDCKIGSNAGRIKEYGEFIESLIDNQRHLHKTRKIFKITVISEKKFANRTMRMTLVDF